MLSKNFDWSMVRVGMYVGLGAVLVDAILTKTTKTWRLPPLAMGIGMYLPPAMITPIICGGVLHAFRKRKLKREGQKGADNSSVMIACGIVAGGSIVGVLLAIPFVIYGSSSILAIVGPGFEPLAKIIGALSLLFLAWWLYRAKFEGNRAAKKT